MVSTFVTMAMGYSLGLRMIKRGILKSHPTVHAPIPDNNIKAQGNQGKECYEAVPFDHRDILCVHRLATSS